MENFYKWYNEKPNLYDSELSLLKRGLGGIFKLIKTIEPSDENMRVQVFGSIVFDEGREQGVQIIFPAKYPISPPKIFAMDFTFDESHNIKTKNIHNFNKGNQYSDGSICLFSRDLWNNDHHNIGWCLKRAKNWLISANSKDGFKQSEIIDEVPVSIPYQGQVILPKHVHLPKNVNTGEITLTQFKPDFYIHETNIIPTSPFTLILNKEIFQWIKVKRSIKVKNILSPIDPNNYASLIVKYLGQEFLKKNNNKLLNIAFFIPDDPIHWHFFKVQLQDNQFKIIKYYISRIVEDELYLRTKDVFDNKILINKRVTIIGLGALGSEVAKSLSRNGVGHFNLYDNDIFEIGNSIRHAADLYYIGERKVDVVKNLILRSNPNITVNEFFIDVLDDDELVEESLSNSDLCIVLTAEDSVDYFFNDYYAKKYRIPFIFGRVSNGGLSGSIQVVEIGKSPCLRCLSLANEDTLPVPKKDLKFKELSMEYGSCSLPPLPGSEVDTKEIALQISRISLQCLLDNNDSNYPNMSGKQFFWHGPMGSASHSPFSWEIKNLNKVIDCPHCHE